MPLRLADLARYPRPGTAVPDRVRFTPDGRAVTYLHSADGSLVRSLWRHELDTGERRVLVGPAGVTDEATLDRDEELRRERQRLREVGVTDYAWAEEADPPVLLVPSRAGVLIGVGGEPPSVVPGTQGVADPRLSRDGRQLAFVRGDELHVMALPDGVVRRLTNDAEDGVTNGLAEYVAQEELDRDRGHWWSPTGDRLAFTRVDSRHIPRYPIVHQGRDVVDVEEHRYPFAGAANAFVQLGVIDVASGAATWMDLGPDRDVYLARVAWRPDGTLAGQVLSRDQRSARWLSFDANGDARLLWEERGEPWLNLEDGPHFLRTGEIVHTSEASGFRHLVLRDSGAGGARQLTTGEWVVTRLVTVDEETRVAFVIGTLDGPLERNLYAVPLDGGQPRRMTPEPGWHDVEVDAGGGRFADRHSTRAQAPRVSVRANDGGTVAVLHEPDVSPESLGIAPPELLTLDAADGTPLHGALYRRAAGTGPRPMVVAVYGGPHAQTVTDSWALTIDLRAQHLAEAGFVVLKVDNRGSANRGLAFEAAIAERMGFVEVDDQAAAATSLVERGVADPERIGIYGWSYGGYMTLMTMAARPDLFRVGVAGAPVTAWDGYDTGYTERYMRHPDTNAEGYRASAVLSRVDDLSGALLLVHGAVDENVHFRHTARLLEALNHAQKRFELLLMPEERHMPREARALEYLERRIFEHFRHHLLPDEA